MRSSAERHVEGALLDVSEIPWDVLMRAGEDALSQALHTRRAELERLASGAGVAEATSLFANYAAPA